MGVQGSVMDGYVAGRKFKSLHEVLSRLQVQKCCFSEAVLQEWVKSSVCGLVAYIRLHGDF
jgi:hypothetical protein